MNEVPPELMVTESLTVAWASGQIRGYLKLLRGMAIDFDKPQEYVSFPPCHGVDNIVSEELVQYNRKFHRRWLDVWTAALHASRVGGNG